MPWRGLGLEYPTVEGAALAEMRKVREALMAEGPVAKKKPAEPGNVSSRARTAS